jgi:uncharacterized membrane protein HdeD (DUF308 family)
MSGLFTPQTGGALIAYIIGALAISAGIFFLLTLLPGRARKPLIAVVTFLAGLFYATEFFWPVATSGEMKGQNFLTPYLKPFSDMTTVLQAFALGIGVYSLANVHLRAVARRREGWGFSVVLLTAVLTMVIPAIGKEYNSSPALKNFYLIIYDGAYNSLVSTMFSIVAFYIVSAAYRAFRVRSREATIILASAFLIMIGQVALGQAMTNAIPNTDFSANFRVENVTTWILTKVNSPALLGVDFGLGIGALAASLRLWLSLERGSYFDEEL